MIEIIKPFFENLKNENINDEKYIFHFLKHFQTFSKYQLEVLYENGIITEEKFNVLIPKKTNSTENEINTIVSGLK